MPDEARHPDTEAVRDFLQHVILISPITDLWMAHYVDLLDISICCERRLVDLRYKRISYPLHISRGPASWRLTSAQYGPYRGWPHFLSPEIISSNTER